MIERVNESRATREAAAAPRTLSLFDVYKGDQGETFEEGWRNKLIWGDNLPVMGSLLGEFAGKIDLVYIDPPFATGADFTFVTQIGESDMEVEKEQSLIEERAYRDTWGKGLQSYLNMMRERLVLIRELLSDSGVLYLHLGPEVSHYLKLVCDEVFGSDGFLNEIVWKRTPFAGSSKALAKKFPVNHDNILFYAKRDDLFSFQHIYEEYSEEYKARFKYEDERGFYRKTLLKTYSRATELRLKEEGRWINPIKPGAYPSYKQYLHESKGRQVEDIWSAPDDDLNGGQGNVWEDLNLANPMADERTGYATQKPEVLLQRILTASSKPGDLVADFFAGSGTTMAVAEKLNRRWIGCDLGRWAVHISRKRLLQIRNCKPFEVLNLGRYERQYWQAYTFHRAGGPHSEHALYQYLAFILKLYRAQPVSGLAHLHGKKAGAMVHVGAVDSPVTIDEILAALQECVALKQAELHVLGWEWEMGLNDLMADEARGRGVKLVLLHIPREVMERDAAERGDVSFFEMAYADFTIETLKPCAVAVKLSDFVIPNTELIPPEIREKVNKWSDYIDYWSIDWDFQNDTFMQGWVTYRTRKNRRLELRSDEHVYVRAGRYRIVVKVIDIFGNDTSHLREIEVK